MSTSFKFYSAIIFSNYLNVLFFKSQFLISRAGKYTFDVGTTKTINRHVKKVEYEIVSTRIIRDVQSDTMDTS